MERREPSWQQLCILLVASVSAATVDGACRSSWSDGLTSCINAFQVKRTWEKASVYCKERNANLIDLKGELAQITVLKKLISLANVHYFVGGKKTQSLVSGSSSSFKWRDGTTVDASLIHSTTGTYLHIKPWENSLSRPLFSTDGNHEAYFICQYSKVSMKLSTSPSSSVKLLTLTTSTPLSQTTEVTSSSSTTTSQTPLTSPSLQVSPLPSTKLPSSPAPQSSPASSSTSQSPLASSAPSLPSQTPSPSSSLNVSPLPSTKLPSSLTPQSSPIALSTPLASSAPTSPSQTPLPSSSLKLSSSPSTTSSSSYTSSSLSQLSTSVSSHPIATSDKELVPSPSSTLPSPTSSSFVNNGDQGVILENSLIAKFRKDVAKLNVNESSSLKECLNMTQKLLDDLEAITHLNENPLLASRDVEDFALRYAGHQLKQKEILIKRKSVVLLATNVRNVHEDFMFTVPEKTKTSKPTKIIIPSENFIQNDTSVVVIYFTTLDRLAKNFKQNGRDSIGSDVLVAAVRPSMLSLVKNITLGFKVDEPKRSSEQCSFWDFSAKVPGWSHEGCTVGNATDHYVMCSCNHLTHFAVLMQVHNNESSPEDDKALTILTYIGLSFSIFGCVLTLLAYLTLTDVKSEQSQIRMNLVCYLACANLLFLLNSFAKQYIFVCVTFAVLLQFFYTSALCWMFAEGLQLYQQIVKVFNSSLKMKQVYCFAWGMPTLLIVCSLGIAGNHQDGFSSLVSKDLCWLSVQNRLIWVFIVPVFVLILGNLVILGMVIKELNKVDKSSDSLLSTFRTNLKAFGLLSPLLGITWLTGLLCILGVGVVGLYLFTILNSSQGFFIFIFYCVRNSEIQAKLQRKVKAIDDSHYQKRTSNKTQDIQHKPRVFKSHHENVKLSDFDQSGFKDTSRHTWPVG